MAKKITIPLVGIFFHKKLFKIKIYIRIFLQICTLRYDLIKI